MAEQLALDLAEHYEMPLEEAVARLAAAIRLLPLDPDDPRTLRHRRFADVPVTLTAADGSPVL